MPSNRGHSDTINRTISDNIEHYRAFKNMSYPEHIKRRALELKAGRSFGDVLRKLQEEFPDETDSLTTRTISRWAEKRLNETIQHPAKQETTNIPLILNDSWKEHNAKLLAVASTFLGEDFKNVMKSVADGKTEYIVFDGFASRFDDDDLIIELEQNYEKVIQEYGEWFYNTCFIPHFYAELPKEYFEEKHLFRIVEEQPYLIMDTLRLVLERKTFKGTCPVCKDWASTANL